MFWWSNNESEEYMFLPEILLYVYLVFVLTNRNNAKLSLCMWNIGNRNISQRIWKKKSETIQNGVWTFKYNYDDKKMHIFELLEYRIKRVENTKRVSN